MTKFHVPKTKKTTKPIARISVNVNQREYCEMKIKKKPVNIEPINLPYLNQITVLTPFWFELQALFKLITHLTTIKQ